MIVYEYNVKQGKAKVRIVTDEISLLVNIKNYLELESNVGIGDLESVWTIQAFTNEDKYELLLPYFDNAQEIELEYKDVGKVKNIDGKRYILNCRTLSILLVEEKKIIIYNKENRGLFIDAYKALRQLMIHQFMELGALPVHSSSIALGGQGILFVGKKKAGKTTLSVKSALKYGRMCEYLGNDRMFIYKEEEKYYLYSIPTVIGMGLGMISDDKALVYNLTDEIHKKAGNTASMLLDQPCISESMILLNKIDELEQNERWNYIKDKIWLTPAELSVLTGCKCGLAAELKYIIIPEISNEKAKITEYVVDAKEVLLDNILDMQQLYPNWLGLHFDFNIDKKKYIDDLLANVKVYGAHGEPEQILELFADLQLDKKNVLRNQLNL